MSVIENLTVDKYLSVKKWNLEGSLISFFIKEPCFAKKDLKSPAFFLKSVSKLFHEIIVEQQVVYSCLKKLLIKTNVLLWSFEYFLTYFPIQ